ncbi:MAG: hypothetical protein KGI04_04010 [Candidatus Micrarchaeota archaeon]|nr:hypothetical protein [Candidatus Micrarchaeota archaeon]
MQRTRDEARARFVEGTLRDFAATDAKVVVEGNHDVSALRKLNIEAVTVTQLPGLRLGIAPRIFFVSMDVHDGAEKERTAISLISERYPSSIINVTAGKRLQKGVGATSMEEIVGPIAEIRRKANGDRNEINW